MVETGTIPALQKLRDRIPPGLAAITRLPGVGPKRVRALYDQLGIDSLESLREAAESGRLRDAKGFGAKFEESVLAALEAGAAERPAPRVVLDTAMEVGEQVVAALRAHPAAVHVEIAGSARRLADSVKDLDIVAAATDPGALAAALAGIDVLETRARRARTPPAAARTRAWASTCASSNPISSATSCSTSPARRPTTWPCARPPCAADCTSPSTGSSTTPPARRPGARPRRRSTSASACRGSSRSCARIAASLRRASSRRGS